MLNYLHKYELAILFSLQLIYVKNKVAQTNTKNKSNKQKVEHLQGTQKHITLNQSVELSFRVCSIKIPQ